MQDRIEFAKDLVRLSLLALWPGLEVEGEEDARAFEAFANAGAWKLRQIKERMGWENLNSEGTRKRWNPSIQDDPEEQAAGAERLRVMGQTGQAPHMSGVNWDYTPCMMTAGLDPKNEKHRALAAHIFSTPSAWENYKTKRGLVELTKYDVKNGGAADTPPIQTRADLEADAIEDVKEALAHMSNTGQMRDGVNVANAPFIPMAVTPRNGNGVKPQPRPTTTEYRSGYADIPDSDSDPNTPDVNPRVMDPRVEAELRVMAAEQAGRVRSPEAIRAELESDSLNRGLAKAAARGAL